MTQNVPAPIASYYAGANAKNVEAATAAFDDTAVVVDEGETHVGHAAIASWLAAVFAKYGVTSEVTEVVAQGAERYRVAALVSGNFPGSPATLHYDFTLSDKHIARLSIG